MNLTEIQVESSSSSSRSTFSWDAMVQQAAAKPPSPLEATSKKAIEAMQQQAASMESMQEAAIARETQLLQDNQVLAAQNTQLHTLLAAERATAQKLIEDQQQELELLRQQLTGATQTLSHVRADFNLLCQNLKWRETNNSGSQFSRSITPAKSEVLHQDLIKLKNHLKEK